MRRNLSKKIKRSISSICYARMQINKYVHRQSHLNLINKIMPSQYLPNELSNAFFFWYFKNNAKDNNKCARCVHLSWDFGYPLFKMQNSNRILARNSFIPECLLINVLNFLLLFFLIVSDEHLGGSNDF